MNTTDHQYWQCQIYLNQTSKYRLAEIGVKTMDLTLASTMEETAIKATDRSIERYRRIYNETIVAWDIKNFTSNEEMLEKLQAFIIEMMQSEIDLRAKIDTARHTQREILGKLGKEERDALINNPNFKPAKSPEWEPKKPRLTKKEKNSVSLKELGLDLEDLLGG